MAKVQINVNTLDVCIYIVPNAPVAQLLPASTGMTNINFGNSRGSLGMDQGSSDMAQGSFANNNRDNNMSTLTTINEFYLRTTPVYSPVNKATLHHQTRLSKSGPRSLKVVEKEILNKKKMINLSFLTFRLL